jgi:lipoprotein-anchoring transpeptidase ErfK/SrfK
LISDPGVFAVIEKNRDHHSTLYDDAWMPNMQRITWNGIALHGGPLPGYAASHGCVRMPYDFAEKLDRRLCCWPLARCPI